MTKIEIAVLKRQRAIASLLAIAKRVAAAGIAPMSMKEIDAEVKAVRAERRRSTRRR